MQREESRIRTRIMVLLALTLMLAGRAMTVAFIGRAGGTGVGDPPLAWTMPLVGDAVIGLLALPIAYLIWRRRTVGAWTLIVVWNAVAIFDALAAYVVHATVPWPSFFMIELFGASMFFAASALHAACIALVASAPMRRAFFGHPVPA